MELKIENLSKRYGSKEALKDVNIVIKEGAYGFLGENGAGKSTLMRILTTVDRQTKGNIYFNGTKIEVLDERYRELIGYMPQDYSIYKSFTAKDFLEYMGALKGIPKNKLEERIVEVLEIVNLSHCKNKRVSTFSGGMKRRIGIAQAILNNPKILILDEPTAGLDPKERIRFSNIISSMAKDKIVILSTHIVSDIEAIANNLIVIKKGEILNVEKVCEAVERVRGLVFETLITQEQFNILLDKRQIIHRKQEENMIKVRYVGEVFSEFNSRELEPTLEDYYMHICI